jgi:hypothetical protein
MTDLLGHNIAAPTDNIIERLEADFAALLATAADELNAVEQLPEVIATADDTSAVASAVIKLRDLAARCESHRRAEKEVWLRGCETVDAFFFRRLRDPLNLMRRVLSRRLDVFKQRQLAEARAQREAEAVNARQQQLQARCTVEEAEDAAGRARSTESKLQREQEAAAARVESDVATVRAENATLATKAPAGRLVGEHFEGARSGQVSMRMQPVVFIDDISLLDLETLRPFIKEEYLLQALRAWARATGFAQQMPGATIALRETTVVR